MISQLDPDGKSIQEKREWIENNYEIVYGRELTNKARAELYDMNDAVLRAFYDKMMNNFRGGCID